MKISTAMALGRTMIMPLAGVHLSTDQKMGCALGMVQIAAPSLWQDTFMRARHTLVTTPCTCEMGHVGGMAWDMIRRTNSLNETIIHLFNHHVMVKKDWTMDQLIDWVASVEPRDPEEAVTEHAKTQEAIPVEA